MRRKVTSLTLDPDLTRALAELAREHEGNASQTMRYLIRSEVQRREMQPITDKRPTESSAPRFECA